MKMFKFVLMKVLQIVILIVIVGFCTSSCKKIQQDDDSFIIANVFTPNEEDNNNVFFEVKSSTDGEVVLLKIYTRAGVLVYSYEKQLHTWDGCSLNGQPMANGVYYYYAEIVGASPKVAKSGFFHLFR